MKKILEKEVKIHQKLNEMVSRSVPKAILEVIRFQKMSRGDPASIFLAIIGATWAILVAIWCPAGRQGGSQNRAFWHQVTKKSTKWGPGIGLRKSLKFWLKFVRFGILFGAIFHQKSIKNQWKNRCENRCRKSHENSWNFNAKMVRNLSIFFIFWCFSKIEFKFSESVECAKTIVLMG